MIDVSARTGKATLFVVPQYKANRSIGLHRRIAEYARQLHYQRSAGAIVVRCLTQSAAVHVGADYVHFFGMPGADFGAVDLLPWTRRH